MNPCPRTARAGIRGRARLLACLLAAGAASACTDSGAMQIAGGQGGGGSSATETNVAPLHCNASSDCPSGAQCVDSACSTAASDSDGGAELPP